MRLTRPGYAGSAALIAMEENEDWLLRPVLRGLCRYESLKDGTLDLADVALLNELLDVEAENEYRVDRATK